MDRFAHSQHDPPGVVIEIDHEAMEAEVVYDLPDGYMWLGSAPVPRNRWEAFLHHICHGLLMRYPLWKVIAWSWQHRDIFEDES